MAFLNPELIGSIAGFSTTMSFVPQVVKVLRYRDTTAISSSTYVVYLFGIVLWIVYGLMIHSMAILVANIVTLILAALVLGLKFYFEREPVAH